MKTFFIKNGTNFLFSSIAIAQYRDRLATYENKGILKISKFVVCKFRNAFHLKINIKRSFMTSSIQGHSAN